MDKKVKLFLLILVSVVILCPVYFMLTFFTELASLTPNAITLAIAFLLAFTLFKNADNPIVPGIIISLFIFIASLLFPQLYLSSTSVQVSAGTLEILSMISVIQNPILYYASFLVLFNLPFVIKAVLNKRKKKQALAPVPAAA